MNQKTTIVVAAVTLLTAAAPNAHAAPGASLSKPAAAASTEQIAWRRWGSHHGVRRCSYGSGAYGYRPHYPEAYRTGTRHWWEEMDRVERGGRR